ncbi:MAG: NUDIX domain-containing protein [Candidatus Diapherotrites archaeon]|nr:NUDIX domain-containing protein [Candidatus Diapherotrites archaeon]
MPLPKSSAESKEDLIEIVDFEGKVLRTCNYREAFEKNLLKKCVHVLVFNYEGKVLLEFRKNDKRFFPSYWNSSAAGFVGVGESELEAAERELKEELGVSAGLHFIERFIIDTADDCCINYFFACLHDGPFECNEAEKIQFFEPSEAKQLKITPHLRLELNLFENNICPLIQATFKKTSETASNRGF